MIKLLQFYRRVIVHLIYAIVEVQLRSTSVANNEILFIEKKIFSFAYIIRSAYMIPATAALLKFRYINNNVH